MKAFGYATSNPEELSSLSEVTFQCSADDLRCLAGFFLKCADDIISDDEWEHEHLNDYAPDHVSSVDIVVFKD